MGWGIMGRWQWGGDRGGVVLGGVAMGGDSGVGVTTVGDNGGGQYGGVTMGGGLQWGGGKGWKWGAVPPPPDALCPTVPHGLLGPGPMANGFGPGPKAMGHFAPGGPGPMPGECPIGTARNNAP